MKEAGEKVSGCFIKSSRISLFRGQVSKDGEIYVN